MVSHCPTCSCEPVYICFGLHRKSVLMTVRFLTILIYLGIAVFMGEVIWKRGLDDWDKFRYNILRFLMLLLSMCFTTLIVLNAMPYWGIISSCMLGIWYVTEDFITNPPLLRFRDRFFGRRVNPEVRVSGPVNDCATGGDPPPLPPKRNVVLRGENPRSLPTITIDPRPTSLTTPRHQHETKTLGILSRSEQTTSPPVHKPQTKRQTKKDRFKKRMNDIVSLKPIEEYGEPHLQAGVSHIEIPLSRLLSKPSFSGETSEETSFSSVTDHSEVERRSRISKYRDARRTSRTEQVSAEERLPLFGVYENLPTSGEIAHAQASGSKDIKVEKGQTSKSYIPVATLQTMQSFKAKSDEKSKDQKRTSSQGQTSTETLRHETGSQIKSGEIKQGINEQRTAARKYVQVSTLAKPTSELHAAAKFEKKPKQDTEQPSIERYKISNILLRAQSADQEKMRSEIAAEENKSVQPSLGNVLDGQNTQSLAEGLPHPSSSVSRDLNSEVQTSNRPTLHLSSGFAVPAEEGATAAGSITHSQVFDDQLEEVIDASHIDVGEIQIKPSGDQPALTQACEVKRLESREQTSTQISQGSYVRRRAGDDFSLTSVSRGTDAPTQIHRSMSRPSRDVSSLPVEEEAASREISNIGRPGLHLSSGITIVRDDSADGTESPELEDIFDQPNDPIDATDLSF